MTWPGQVRLRDHWEPPGKRLALLQAQGLRVGTGLPQEGKEFCYWRGARAGKTTSVFSTTVSYGVDYGYGESSGELREEGKETVEWKRVFMGQVGLELRGFDVGGLAQ